MTQSTTSVTSLFKPLAVSSGPLVKVEEQALAANAAQGLEIVFAANASPGDDVICTFREPEERVAVSHVVDLDRLSHRADAQAPPTDRLSVSMLQNGHAVPADEQRRVDEWIAEGGVAVIDLLMRGDRVRWRPGRCVVQGAPDRWREILQAVASFSFYEGELRKLETELEAAMPIAERDSDLAGRVDGAALARWSEVQVLARQTAVRRIRYLHIERHLERPPPTLSSAGQRAVNELGIQSDVAGRLMYVDDRIEVCAELYAIACERLSEFSYFRRSQTVEIAILGVLIVEVLLMAKEFFAR
jgi:hypothetical protein